MKKVIFIRSQITIGSAIKGVRLEDILIRESDLKKVKVGMREASYKLLVNMALIDTDYEVIESAGMVMLQYKGLPVNYFGAGGGFKLGCYTDLELNYKIDSFYRYKDHIQKVIDKLDVTTLTSEV